MNGWAVILLVVAAFWAGNWSGWISAHVTVARECKKLGAFYVGDTTYQCTAIEKRSAHVGE